MRVSPASAPPTADDALARLAGELHAELGTAALAAGAVLGDGASWSGAYGLADVARGAPATTATHFRIGSVTKTFTATLALLLVEEGLLALDMPAVERIPELAAVRTQGRPLAAVTLRTLLTHRSGLTSDPPTCDWATSRFPERAELLATLDRVELAIEPGTWRKYSNVGSALVGELIARATGLPPEAAIEQRLLAPLELGDTGFHRTVDPLAATGYTSAAAPADWTDIGGLAPAGSLTSTVPDLLAWLALQLGHRASAALPATVLARLHAPEGATEDLHGGWTLGWFAFRRDGRVVLQQSGGIDGFTCSVAFDRATRTGAVLLTNGEVDPGPAVLRLLDAARLHGPVPAPGPAPAAAAVDRSLLGSWTGAIGMRLELSERDGALCASGYLLDHEPGVTLAPLGDDAYQVDRGRFAGELLRVERTPDGAAQALQLASWRYERA